MLRKFGIELECYHPTISTSGSQSALPQKIRHLGYPSVAANYTGRAYTSWQVKPDGSLRPAHLGVEVVSRILDGSEAGLIEAATVARMLDNDGYKVNRSCGMHVHVDVSDLTMAQRIAVAYRWSALKDEIKSILPPSRWDQTNHYSTFMNDNQIALMGACVKAQLAGRDNRDYASMYRTMAVNLTHVENGRLEFRQHSGTVNADKIVGWVRFLNEFIDDTKALCIEAMQPSQAASAPLPPTSNTRTSRFSVDNFRRGSRSAILFDRMISRGSVTLAELNADGGQVWTQKALADAIYPLRQAGMNIVRNGTNESLRYIYNPQVSSLNQASRTVDTSRDVLTLLKRNIRLSVTVKAWVDSRKAVFAEDLGA